MGIEFSTIFYSSIAGVSTILGIIMVILKQGWVLRHSHYVNSSAAGVIGDTASNLKAAPRPPRDARPAIMNRPFLNC
jgi:hypothetical protein